MAAVEWPELTEADRRLLVGLPVWDEAVNTEHETAVLVWAMADHETDPVMAEASGVQAFEEERRAALVSGLTEHYSIEVHRRRPRRVSRPDWAFLRSGWGESIDSFFAFGVYASARDTDLVASDLLAVFDTVMQEEARHILFFENWRLLRRSRPASAGASMRWATGDALAACSVVLDRLRTAVSSPRGGPEGDQNFLLSGARELAPLTPRQFVRTCLAENERRLSCFDEQLPRPRAVPRLMRSLDCLLPDRPFVRQRPALRRSTRSRRCAPHRARRSRHVTASRRGKKGVYKQAVQTGEPGPNAPVRAVPQQPKRGRGRATAHGHAAR